MAFFPSICVCSLKKFSVWVVWVPAQFFIFYFILASNTQQQYYSIQNMWVEYELNQNKCPTYLISDKLMPHTKIAVLDLVSFWTLWAKIFTAPQTLFDFSLPSKKYVVRWEKSVSSYTTFLLVTLSLQLKCVLIHHLSSGDTVPSTIVCPHTPPFFWWHCLFNYSVSSGWWRMARLVKIWLWNSSPSWPRNHLKPFKTI